MFENFKIAIFGFNDEETKDIRELVETEGNGIIYTDYNQILEHNQAILS